MDQIIATIREFIIALFDKLQKLVEQAFVGQHDQVVNPTDEDITGADDLVDPIA